MTAYVQIARLRWEARKMPTSGLTEYRSPVGIIRKTATGYFTAVMASTNKPIRGDDNKPRYYVGVHAAAHDLIAADKLIHRRQP